MSDVSVIGCGNMGSAMARALRATGSEVIAWNRTREKAEDLAGPGVDVADTVAEALMASPVTLVSVTDYEATREVLDGEEGRLAGRTLVQLSNGTPDAARALAERVSQEGGDYLDGTVFSYPKAVGTEQLLIMYSGDPEVFEATRPLLERLGGTATHLSEDPGAASALDLAAVPPAMLAAIAIWQGAKICEIEGVPFEIFAKVIQSLVPAIAEDALQKAADPDLPTDPDKVEVSVRQAAEDAQRPIDYFESAGLDAGHLRALKRLFEAGVEEGRGDHGISCVAELHA
jgi:3-hydroxyisobutyrate dehydrogenase-like beta-hydroxyacid dehydrogenase